MTQIRPISRPENSESESTGARVNREIRLYLCMCGCLRGALRSRVLQILTSDHDNVFPALAQT